MELPVCINNSNTFQQQNKLLKKSMFNCFLLDKNNRIVCIGNPVYSLKLKDLSLITGKKSAELPKTEAVLLTDKNIDIGKIKLGETQKIIFTIKNIGEAPLFIRNITTSCGCTSVNYSKAPILKDKSTKSTVFYEAEEIGIFNKEIKIQYNGDNSPIVLQIRGTVSE